MLIWVVRSGLLALMAVGPVLDPGLMGLISHTFTCWFPRVVIEIVCFARWPTCCPAARLPRCNRVRFMPNEISLFHESCLIICILSAAIRAIIYASDVTLSNISGSHLSSRMMGSNHAWSMIRMGAIVFLRKMHVWITKTGTQIYFSNISKFRCLEMFSFM